MKILNLYCGIGGNRALWQGHQITAVEHDRDIAEVYAKRFPDDEVICGDAASVLTARYQEFDMIWASPPCQSHGQYRHNVGVLGKGFAPLIPDMTNLYGTIVFLKTYYAGLWIVENTRPFYAPLIPPTLELDRHLYWSNASLEAPPAGATNLRTKNKIADFDESEFLEGSRIKNKRQVLRNCVNSTTALHLLNSALQKEARL